MMSNGWQSELIADNKEFMSGKYFRYEPNKELWEPKDCAEEDRDDYEYDHRGVSKYSLDFRYTEASRSQSQTYLAGGMRTTQLTASIVTSTEIDLKRNDRIVLQSDPENHLRITNVSLLRNYNADLSSMQWVDQEKYSKRLISLV